MAESKFCEIKFSDTDVVNPEEYDFGDGKVWLLHDHGFVVCVVFASNLQDALDEACNWNKLDRYMIEESSNTPGVQNQLPASDYPTLGTENEDGITRLGNASEPFDIESLEVLELPNPKFSFCAMFNAR